jgi:hypothetical protein
MRPIQRLRYNISLTWTTRLPAQKAGGLYKAYYESSDGSKSRLHPIGALFADTDCIVVHVNRTLKLK